MRFEDIALAGFLLAMFFIAYHDIDYMTLDHDPGLMTAVVYSDRSTQGAAPFSSYKRKRIIKPLPW